MNVRDFDDVFDLVHRRCTLEILTALESGHARWTALLHDITPRPHSKTFGDAIRHLVLDGYVRQQADAHGAYYELTESGTALIAIVRDFVDHLEQWRILLADGYLAA
ncbi:hypothetical protein Lfu02_75610 [Longispora fulva]|uniref:DNA-binding HxlR family transcriptional regulator n=1 Tax=Longispora fulva TaxID=619741 RepID=A0A8J7KPH1_9ACTN|nr:winged helix-turn-helix transcriptional regulator [Longispora fulva]MBG6136302.1 DNA-binding HxlR family transcriptional regulator [Longispora fulva]GIG63189.1 hypothetical protein Lfu02_75610 [Longispora fulva]